MKEGRVRGEIPLAALSMSLDNRDTVDVAENNPAVHGWEER